MELIFVPTDANCNWKIYKETVTMFFNNYITKWHHSNFNKETYKYMIILKYE